MADINLGVGGANSAVAGGYDIDNSLKFEADNTEYLERDPSSTGNRKIFTTSMWVKRTELGQASTIFGVYPTSGAGNTTVVQFGFTSDDKFQCGFQTFYVVQTNRVFRDTSAWYHIVVRIDTTQSTATDRFKVWINGVEETSFSTDGRASIGLNQDTGINFTEPHRIGTLISNSWYFSGYMADINHIDGSAKSPTDFGEYDEDSGIWKPKAYTGSYGTNGFYLDFESSGSLGADSSGNGNNFTLNNITAADQATDTPTNNFCTFNPLQTVTGKWVVSNGATSVIQGADYGYLTHAGNMGFKKGKWYAEFKAGTGTVQAGVGMNQLDNTGAWENSYIGAYSNSTAIGMCKSQDGYFYRNGGSGALGVTWTAGDILGIAIVINADGTGFMGMSKNGTWENSQDPSSGTSGMLGLYYGNPLPDNLFHSFAIFTRRNNGAMLANFGGFSGFTISSGNSDANGYGNFEYTVPTGYYALCTKNLSEFG